MFSGENRILETGILLRVARIKSVSCLDAGAGKGIQAAWRGVWIFAENLIHFRRHIGLFSAFKMGGDLLPLLRRGPGGFSLSPHVNRRAAGGNFKASVTLVGLGPELIFYPVTLSLSKGAWVTED